MEFRAVIGQDETGDNELPVEGLVRQLNRLSKEGWTIVAMDLMNGIALVAKAPRQLPMGLAVPVTKF